MSEWTPERQRAAQDAIDNARVGEFNYWTLKDMVAEITRLTSSLRAVTEERDDLTKENAQLKNRINDELHEYDRVDAELSALKSRIDSEASPKRSVGDGAAEDAVELAWQINHDAVKFDKASGSRFLNTEQASEIITAAFAKREAALVAENEKLKARLSVMQTDKDFADNFHREAMLDTTHGPVMQIDKAYPMVAAFRAAATAPRDELIREGIAVIHNYISEPTLKNLPLREWKGRAQAKIDNLLAGEGR